MLVAVIYPVGYEGGVPWREGLRFGLLMGVLFTLPGGLVIVDAAWHRVEQGAGGIGVALVHGGVAVAATGANAMTDVVPDDRRGWTAP